MKRRLIILAAAALCGLTACASSRTQPESASELQQLQARLESSEKKVEQLSQQVALLQTMVDRQQRNRQAVEGTGTSLAERSQPAPDPGVISQESLEETPAGPPARPAVTATAPEPEASTPDTTDVTPRPQPAPEPAASIPGKAQTEELSAPDVYDEAMSILRAGEFERAGDRFKDFARRFPDDDLADNALYWAGECNYTQKKFNEAIVLFKQVVEQYPAGSKVPDALLKTGYAYISLGDRAMAATYLKQVIAKYPFSAAAAKAEARLETLR